MTSQTNVKGQAMSTSLGQMIYDLRLQRGLTQDQMGHCYGISGPAVFKFEKGYVNPSLKLWLRIAADMGLGEQEAVLAWARAKLPESLRDRIDLRRGAAVKRGATDFSQLMDLDRLRQAALADPTLPAGLRSMVKDDELWALYKPTGLELNLLRELARSVGEGKKSQWREALRALRAFEDRED